MDTSVAPQPLSWCSVATNLTCICTWTSIKNTKVVILRHHSVTVQLHTFLSLVVFFLSASLTIMSFQILLPTSLVQLPSPVLSPASGHAHLVSLIPFTWSSCPSHLLLIPSLVHVDLGPLTCSFMSSARLFCVFQPKLSCVKYCVDVFLRFLCLIILRVKIIICSSVSWVVLLGPP